MKSIGVFDNQELYLDISSYINGRLYLALNSIEEPYSDITINLPESTLPNNTIFLTNDMSSELKSFLKEKNIIGDTLYLEPYGKSEYEVAFVDFEILKEYNLEGFKEYDDYVNKKCNENVL